MRRTLHILSRALLGVFLTVYIALALVNYSLVQSLAGAWAGKVLSERSGGVVRVGSIGANPLDHAMLHDVLLCSPDGDTVAFAERVSVRFNRWPWRDNQLTLGYVGIRNGGFHLVSETKGDISLNYLLRLFRPERPREKKEPQPFELHIRTVELQNLRYHHDIPGRDLGYSHGAVYHKLDFSKIFGRFSGLCIDERGRVTCRLHHLECHEVAGMNVTHIGGDVDVGPQGIIANNFELTTDSSRMEADVQLLFRDWKTTQYWCDSVRMYVVFKPGTDLSMTTAAYWAPTLWGMDSRARITGTVRGPLADMEVENLQVRMGHQTHLVVDGTVRGLPDIERTRFDVQVSRLSTHYDDLCAVRHPDRMPPVEVLPLLKKLGKMEAILSFEGRVSDFRARADLATEAGNLTADLLMRLDLRTGASSYRGEIASSSLLLSSLAENEWVSSTGLSLNVEGRGFDPRTMQAEAEGRLFNTHLRGQPIASTSFDLALNRGIADLSLDVADSLLALSLTGMANIAAQRPFFHLDADLSRADLSALRIAPAYDTLLRLSTHLVASAMVDLDEPAPMESLEATVDLTGTTLDRGRTGRIALQDISLSAREFRHGKRIAISSELFEGDLRGYFSYAALPLVARRLCDQYLPLYYNPFAGADSVLDYSSIADADISLDLTWTDPRQQGRRLLPSLSLAPGSRLRARYGFNRSLYLQASSDSLRLGALGLNDLTLEGKDISGLFVVNLSAEHLAAGRTPLLENLALQAAAKPAVASCELRWRDTLPEATYGDLLLRMSSSPEGNHLALSRGVLLVHGVPWRVQCPEGVDFGRKTLEIRELLLQSEEQSLAVEASVSGAEADHVAAEFRQFDLSQLAFLLEPIGFLLEGTTNGHLRLIDLASTPRLDANLSISALSLNDQYLGDAQLLAGWSPESNRLSLSAETLLCTEAGQRKPLSARGFVDMSTPDPGLSFELSMARFNLQSLAPLASSFASNVEGRLDGHVSLGGTLGHPDLRGSVFVSQGSLLVNANNVTYTFDDNLVIAPDAIFLDSLTLRDPFGNQVVIDGQVRHQGFRDLTLDLSLHSDNLCLLNTLEQGGDFYGTLFASADGRVTGPVGNISIDVNAVTQPGSQLFLPLNNQRQVKDASFITFLSDDNPLLLSDPDGTLYVPASQPSAANRFRVDVTLSVTPDVALNLPVDFNPVHADVSATGQGDLHLSLANDSPLNLLGTYEIGTGSMKVVLASVVTKDFSIDPGSTLDFRGGLDAINFNINAAYNTRVSLATLTGVSASSDHSAQTINVEDVIQLSGTLDNPQIGFDIRFPNADPSVEEEVFSYIDRSNERDMLNQCISLLVSGSFYNTANSTSLENSSATLLVNTLGSVVSGMVSAVDISFDYSGATELTRRKFDMDINKDFGRFYLESTLGIAGIGELTGPQGNELTGDVLLGYKVSPNVHFFVFNRSNTNEYSRSEMPYKQGAGIKLTKDFDRLSDLFKKKKK